ncbi:efflux RND transporter periplasmic adaptor subunit [Hymenobacter sp. 15J16-1T3B]|uniref:efflux RND transporter periplasmic adaptor subunit n=1 Tax=Hymenobacter sp. 15J16-1T3B TaxID=2886941 RepID=UPI001D1024C1|nr:efflux RND transporter periplasmic adaptor subunit [Hymenobacter sp. 15J16-1T3B]MCC3158024.1 efflux RND transporter periplasmic adaptor subunit [Hymenobacter sp. 15J16-1T3B]
MFRIPFLSAAYLLPLALLTALGGCQSSANEKPAPESAEAPAAPSDEVHLNADELRVAGVRTGRVSYQAAAGALRVNGSLEAPPQSLVVLSAPLGGYIERLPLLPGAHVRRGEAVAVVRNPEFIQVQQDYRQVLSQLDYARAELDRQRELVREEVAPAKNLQRAQAEFRSLQAQRDALAARLRLAGLPVQASGPMSSTAELRAPISGFVRHVRATTGQTVTSTEPVAELVDPTHLHVELTVFEKDAPRLAVGQRIRFTLASDSAGKEHLGRITLVSRAVDPEARTVSVHAHPDEEDNPALLPGMFVRATVETAAAQAQAPTLPEAAVVDYEGKSYIFVQRAAGRFRMVEVRRAGAVENGTVPLVLPASVTAETTVATTGAYSLLGKLKNTLDE